MRYRVPRTLFVCLLVFLFGFPAMAALTATPITWGVVGLDSNSPTGGPKDFPVGARICSDVAVTNVTATFVWDSANSNINLRPGSPTSLILPSISAGGCSDAYFEVEVTQVAAAFDTTRRYHITASDGTNTASTPQPREIYVEHLISQNRNAITDVKYGTTLASLTSVPAGGSMNLVVGETYIIQLLGGTATQGYNQFEAFINMPNTIFQILSVSTSYSADDSPFVPNPNDKLYADACKWDQDPNSPTYLSCVGGDFKAGGSNVVTTYTVKVISGGGTSQTLNTLLQDFSGSSFHYNSDFSAGARIASIIDPTSATIAKSFTPNPAPVNSTTALTITLTNPNGGALSGFNFTDPLPAGMQVASTPNATTSGCGTPTFSPSAGATTLAFSNGAVAANGSCVIKVNVITPSSTGTVTNTTNNLFVDTTDTGHSATATLTVNSAPPPGTGVCGQSIASWKFPTGFSLTAPAASSSTVTTSAAIGAGLSAQQGADATGTAGSASWSTNGNVDASGTTLNTANNDYFEFGINTTGLTSVALSFQASRTNNGPKGVAVFVGTTNTRPETGTAISDPSLSSTSLSSTAWTSFGPFTVSSGLNASGMTFFRIYGFNANNSVPGADFAIDNVTFTACGAPVQPTLSKAFSPNPIAVNGTSTLTFTLTNTNSVALTGAAFSDALPSGVQVAATPAAATTCAGATWAPAAGATSLSFSGGTISASGSCTASVNVTATTSGPHTNVTGFLSTTEGGTNTTSTGSATLTALQPPTIAKAFTATPILAGGTSTLVFTVTNNNQNDAITGVAFSDTFPTSPGAMVVAAAPNATTSGCGAPVFAPAAGAGSISFSGGTIAGGGTCTVTVAVTAPAVGTYTNTSGNVSFVVNAQTVNGNTATDSLDVDPPHPSIGLLKQISTASSGPWLSFEAVTTQPVFYQFTVENTGDEPLTNIAISDAMVDVSSCNAAFAGSTLPVAVAANNNHIVTCVVGPVATTAGSHTNTATASGVFSATTFTSPDSTATYATVGLTLAKSVTETSYTLPGEVLHYSYLVTNSGFAPLADPVTVTDNKAPVSCPSTTTVGDLDAFLDPGESVTCTATYTITAPDVVNASVTNTATASAGAAVSNTDSRTVPLSTSADVSMVKTLTTAGPYNAGQSVTYTLVVANAGPSTATGIQVTDAPANLTITNVSGSGCAAIPCTIASLASGANTTITVTATINADGAFDNTASATGAEPDPNTSNNTDSTGNGGTTTASADVSMVKMLTTTGPYTAGQSVTYTLVVANAGPSTATGIQVTDTPTNLTITNVSGSGCAAIPCTIASLASGANTAITITATINAAGAFDNTAAATATEPDPDPSNNTDSSGNGGSAMPPGASADVSVVKTLVTAGPYTAGQIITYTLVVANAGPSGATNIQVNDTPTNIAVTNVSGSGCNAFPCTIAALAAGLNTTISVTGSITAAGAFDNSATAIATEPDPDLSNNTDSTGNGGTATTPAAASADVSIVKTLTTVGPYNAGQSVAYTLVVANAGPSTATNVQVTDTPTNLAITSVSGGGCTAFPCTIGALAPLANTTINVTATINAIGAFDNSATVTASEPDPVPSNNSDSSGNGGSVPDGTPASADVSLVKTLVTAPPYTAGETITYTITVANAGPSTATNVQVTDAPSNLTINTVTGGGCSAFPCSVGTLAPGASVMITASATITATGTFDNTATATLAEPDPDPSNNTDSSGNSGTAGAAVDVSMVKTLTTSGPFTPGQTIAYTLTVANAGPATATGIQVTDTPTNLTITGVSGSGCAALPCTIASLGPGSNTAIAVTAVINAAGAFDNTATATPAETDTNPSNNTDSTGNGGTTGTTAVDLSLVKTASVPSVVVGQTFDYILTIRNLGPSTATAVTLSDPLPANFQLLSATPSAGTCSGTASVSCSIGTMLNGATVTVTLHGTVRASGSLSNTATVSAAETEVTTSNNTSTAGPAIITAGGAPTLGEFGLLMLGMLLAAAGLLMLKR